MTLETIAALSDDPGRWIAGHGDLTQPPMPEIVEATPTSHTLRLGTRSFLRREFDPKIAGIPFTRSAIVLVFLAPTIPENAQTASASLGRERRRLTSRPGMRVKAEAVSRSA